NTYRINRKRGIDQGSIYVAGRIVKHLGILAQAVYEDFDHKVHLGDFDLRYGRQVLLHGTSIEWGASLNNNPTVQDLWDSTPAHHEPYVQPHWAPKPVALPVIEGDLTYRVLGVSAHALFDKHYFVELGDYRKLSRDVLKKSGNYSATQTTIGGSIPYWRGAVQFNAGRHYFSGGVFGLRATFRPDKSYYEADVYIDDGVDLNYQFIDKDDNALSVSAMWLRERRSLTASSLAGISDSDTNKLITRRLNVTYAYYRTLNLSATWFDVRGNPNALLYPSSMSANHSPATRGYIAQVEYAPFGQRDSLAHPWLNFSAGLEQIAYQQFAGAKINYDGAGRDAANNDTTVLYVKAAF
ncbi:MAG TPA: hypothetical protein VG962_03950, partial [Steroidobacteraceae bacterium]|nr:hypothetical protein [Steroidobacteraceae bacterium]